MPLARILAVQPVLPATLIVRWQDGTEDRIDLAAWIAAGGSMLTQLRDQEVFQTAEIVSHGSAVQWAGADDLAIDAAHLRLFLIRA